MRNFIYKLLRQSEKYTKTDMVYLAKGGFWLNGAQVISSVASFGLAIAYANLLDPEIYGSYKYVISILPLLALPSLPGIETALTRSVAEGYLGTAKKALVTKLKWGVISAVASLILAGYYLYTGNIELALAFTFTALIVSPLESYKIYQNYLNGLKQFRYISISVVAAKLFTTAAIFITIFYFDSLLYTLLAFLVSTLLIRVFFWFRSLKKWPPNDQTDPDAVKYGKALTLNTVVATLADQLDKIIIFNYLGPAQLALFQFAIAPLEHIKTGLKSLRSLALPKFSEKEKSEIDKTIYKKIALFMAGLTVMVVLYILIAPLAYQYVFPQYVEATIYSQVFAVSLIAVPVIWIVTAVFESQEMATRILKMRGYTSAFQIVITVALIIPFGLWGAILARVIYRFLSLVVAIYLLKKP